jgi:hypothetical protein
MSDKSVSFNSLLFFLKNKEIFNFIYRGQPFSHKPSKAGLFEVLTCAGATPSGKEKQRKRAGMIEWI